MGNLPSESFGNTTPISPESSPSSIVSAFARFNPARKRINSVMQPAPSNVIQQDQSVDDELSKQDYIKFIQLVQKNNKELQEEKDTNAKQFGIKMEAKMRELDVLKETLQHNILTIEALKKEQDELIEKHQKELLAAKEKFKQIIPCSDLQFKNMVGHGARGVIQNAIWLNAGGDYSVITKKCMINDQILEQIRRVTTCNLITIF